MEPKNDQQPTRKSEQQQRRAIYVAALEAADSTHIESQKKLFLAIAEGVETSEEYAERQAAAAKYQAALERQKK